MPTPSLTPSQRELVDFIKSHQTITRTSPSLKEMASGLGLSAKSIGAVHKLLLQLEERGAIVRRPGRHRFIELAE